MLNEKRVRHMTKLAFYETKEGTEELKIDASSKRKYIAKNVMSSLLWMTMAYGILSVFAYFAFVRYVFADMSEQQTLILFIFLGVAYLSLAIVYGIKARYYYAKKHLNAHYHVKEFKKDLAELDRKSVV